MSIDVERLHDILYECDGKLRTDEELMEIYTSQLPKSIKAEVDVWGMDTVISDEIYLFWKGRKRNDDLDR